MASRSPTILTPLVKSSPAPNTPGVKEPAPLTTPQPVPFPPPQTFDILPPLHGLLLRLLTPHSNNEGASHDVRPTDDTAGPTVPGSSGQQQSSQQQSSSTGNDNSGGVLPTVSSAGPGSASAAAEIAALSSSAPPPLDIKHLPTEASSIKIRIQKAQAVVESLPDVDRSVAEQDKEIAQLEERIARLNSVLSEFGKRAHLGRSGMQVNQTP
ncbi:RNA polymerase II transcription mediator complex subunit 9-domain-containing protein [Aspergillus ambiguus]|uniref:RNA polymerase II mediator complex middle subunit MED9 n=1 Tax=Aspergillus ambiguus TaxID=176160 RepID=UPI003CCD719A